MEEKRVYLDRPRKKSRGLFFVIVFFLAAPFAALGAAGLLRATPAPDVNVTSDVAAVGRRGNISVRVTEPERGLAGVKVELVQGTKTRVLDEKTFPGEE